ncbi:hypothetical protein RCIP0075_00015 [Klebsiella phage RCIP0075]
MAQLIKTPHPVTLEGQEHIAVHLVPGESLFALLSRTLGDQLNQERWNVSVGGVEVPVENWHTCYPKHGQVIECVGDLGRSALMMVAVIALTIWTGGMFAAVAAGAGIAGLGTVASYAVIAGIQVAGSLLINKVLGPKPPGSPDNSRGPESYSLNSTQNQPRIHGAVGLLFGRLRYAPDMLSQVYNYFDRDDMYMAMHLCWGIGVGRVQELRNGDTLLSDYDDAVTEYSAGFTAMPNTGIPLFGDTSSQPGGSLQQEKELLDVVRTTVVNTERIMVNISGSLYGVTRKGKLSMNQEGFQVSVRKVGDVNWRVVEQRPIYNDDRKTQRFTIAFDVENGQYDVRVRRTGQNSQGEGDVCEFSFDTLVSIQKDTSDYRGVARTGFTMRANERLSSQPTAVNGEAVAYAIPVWTGSQWVNEETSNPGAHILKYLRGYYDEHGNLIAGVGLEDEDIDLEGLKAFMVHCRNNGHTYNYFLNADRDHLDVLNSIARAGMGQFTDANGLMSVSWVAEDQPIDATVNMARIKKGTFRVDYSLVGTADGAEIRYWDAEKSKEALLRIPMPGVQTMLNPAKLTLEGVTSEEQAALLGRYHLAQSLYQFKDVSFGTGLENLTYRRLSLLQMQHDLTQWGYGGCVVKAETVGNRIQLTLDEAVPAPAGGRTGYIGVRVPGQRAAAIFKVQPFAGQSNVVTLAEPWPSDLALPGNKSDNPEHDSIWIYDFKETPGLTVRVVNISRAADRSANVSVVVESEQFWTYVRTGFYEPAESGSLLKTRPTVSDLAVTDQQLVLGDVIQDQLVVSFQVDGPYEESVIYTTESDGSLRERARTRSRSAEFNISGPGEYTVTVIPYNRQGLQGKPVTVKYTTQRAGLPPVLVDTFDVEDAPGGIRRYVWGFLPQTQQSADFAGVEIRYIAGIHANPDWSTMRPLGDGIFVSSQELMLPPSGTWTFACRSRNTSGVLSVDQRVVSKQLKADLGEVIGGIEEGQGDLGNKLEKEINDRINADLENAEKAAQDLANKAAELGGLIDANTDRINQNAQELEETATGLKDTTDKLAQEIVDRINGDLNTRLDLTTQITNETEARESDVENLTRQMASIAAGSGEQFDRSAIWYFDTQGDLEGWTGVYGTPTVSDGFLRPANNADGQNTGIQSPVLSLDGAAYRYLKMRVRRQGRPQWLGLVRWITEADRNWDDAKSTTIPEPGSTTNNVAVVDLADIPWGGPSPVRAFRVALTNRQTNSDNIAYDWIAVGRPSPGASLADIREEAQARIAADTAEALKRESLGVQMRGDYEGTDVAGVKSGLVANERDARINGDSVNAQAIQVINARLPAGNGKLATEASVTSLQQATVSADQALGQRIDTINVTLEGKADIGLVNTLRGDVNRIDGTVRAQGQQLTQIDTKLNAVQAQGDNMVLNGTFELGANVGWRYTSTLSVWNGTEGRNGGSAWKAVGSVDGAVQQAQANMDVNMPCTAGESYRFSCYYRTQDFDGQPGQSKIRLADQTGGYLADIPFTGKDQDWRYVERTYQVPVGSTTRAMKLSLWRDGKLGTLWVDDVKLERVTDLVATATAIQGLTTDVNQLKDGVSSSAESLTKLTARLGNTTTYTVLANGMVSSGPTGNPRASGVYRADGSVYPGLGSSRGVRVVSVRPDGTLADTQVFDTYGDPINNATRFNTWYDALPANQWVVIYSSDAVGGIATGVNPNTVKMRENLMDLGMSRINVEGLTASATMFVLVGRKTLQPGNGIQQVSKVPDGADRTGCFVEMPVSFINGVPVGAGDNYRISNQVSINATAIQSLNATVSDINGKVDAQAQLITQLRTDVNDVTSKTAANTQAVQQLTTRTATVEGKVETMGTAVTKLTSEMTSIGGDNLLPNSSFEQGEPQALNAGPYWNLERLDSSIQCAFSRIPSPLPGGGNALRLDWTSTAANQWAGVNRAGPGRDFTRITPLTDYVLSSWLRATAGSRLQIYVVWFNENGDQGLGTITSPGVTATGEWQRITLPARSNNTAVRARVYVGRQFAQTVGAHWIELDNVMFQEGLVATQYKTSGQEAINTTQAQAEAITGLTTQVDKQGQDINAQANQLTQLTTTIEATFNRGDNLNANAIFDNTMEPFRKGNTSATNGDVTWVSGAGQIGSAIQFIHKAGATASPYVVANVGRWSPIKAGKSRKMRTVIVARVVDGAATLTARCRVRTLGVSGEGNNDQTTPNLTATWQRFVLEHPIGDERTDAMSQVWVTNRGTGDCRVLVDRIEFYDITDEIAITGNATAITGLNTKVTQQGTKLDATAQDLTNLKAQVGDVNATAFNQLKTQVTEQGQEQAAQAQQITGIQTSLGGKADAAVVVDMQAQVKNLGQSGNLLANSTFPFWQRSGWGWGRNVHFSELGNPTGGAGQNWAPRGMYGLGAMAGFQWAWGPDDVHWGGTEYDIPVEAGKTYCASTWVNTHRCQFLVEITWVGQDGGSVGLSQSPWVGPSGIGPNASLISMPRPFVIAKAPPNAFAARFRFLIRGSNEANPYFWMYRPMFSMVDAGTTQPPQWSAGGTESSAQWGVNVRADGKIGGIQLAANGLVSSFDVVADVFRVSAPGNGGQRTEYSDGHWRCYYPNGQLATRMGYWA